MAFGFHYPTKAAPTAQWNPASRPEFPVEEPIVYPQQLKGQTAGGKLYVQTKGPLEETFNLNFTLMSEADRDAYRAFWLAVQGAFCKFEYEDSAGTIHSVRIMNDFLFEKTRPGLFRGRIELRKEI